MKLLPRMIVSFGLLVGFTGSLVATSPAMAQIDDDAKARAERRKKRLEGDDADKKDERKAPAQIGAKQRGKNMTSVRINFAMKRSRRPKPSWHLT